MDWTFDDATDGLIWHVLQKASCPLSDSEITHAIDDMTWEQRLDAIACYQEYHKESPFWVPEYPPSPE